MSTEDYRLSKEDPDGTCFSCSTNLDGSRLFTNFRVCHMCGHHFHLSGAQWANFLLDKDSFQEDDYTVSGLDPISFGGPRNYRQNVLDAQRKTGLSEAAFTGHGTFFGNEVVFAALDFSFLGGSTGIVSGERLARAFERAADRQAPLVTVLSTSGTRMREGLLALMQIPRVIVARQKLSRRRVPQIAVLADPTTGSSYAGFVNLADYIIAEPNALIGFSALRSISEREAVPEGAHTAESHLRNGLIDAIVSRHELQPFLGQILDLLTSSYELRMKERLDTAPRDFSSLEAWRTVQLSRHSNRPSTYELIQRMATVYVEIHGDRSGSDDSAITAGFGLVGGEAVVIVGQVRPSEEAPKSGYISAGGFRKARRAMVLAQKFNLPLITFLDTKGADPSLAAEEDGIAAALTRCTETMLALKVPTLAVVTGEANAESAVSMGVADRVLMLQHSIYGVIAPEDAAKILYRDISQADEVAESLRITASDCYDLEIADEIIQEPDEGAHTDHQEAAYFLRRALVRHLVELTDQRTSDRLATRRKRYRSMGNSSSLVRNVTERSVGKFLEKLEEYFPRRKKTTKRPAEEYTDRSEIPF